MSENKIEKIGWIGKGDDVKDVIYSDNPFKEYDIIIQSGKMTKNYWTEADWPPKKVRITIEVI